MGDLSIGRLRGLQACADDRGLFTMVAIDQRGSLTRLLDPEHPAEVSGERIREIKVDLAQVFTRHATAVLVDVEYGLADVVRSGAFAGHCGLLVAVEEGPSSHARFLPGWGVAKIKATGADGVKLLALFNPADEENAAHQRRLVAQLVEECRRHDIPAIVEPVSYGTTPAERPEVVLQTARELVPLGMDLYKAEFPVDLVAEPDEQRALEFCRRLDELCGETPWVILSAGVGMDLFRRQVKLACQAGASGVLAGRALWREAVKEPDRERRLLRLAADGVANFREIAAIVQEHGRPWRPAWPPLGSGWYRDYQPG